MTEHSSKALTKRKPPPNKVVRKLTQEEADHVDALYVNRYEAGFRDGREFVAKEFASAKLAQLQATVKLVEEAGRVLSRAGYMIGKLNGDNSR